MQVIEDLPTPTSELAHRDTHVDRKWEDHELGKNIDWKDGERERGGKEEEEEEEEEEEIEQEKSI